MVVSVLALLATLAPPVDALDVQFEETRLLLPIGALTPVIGDDETSDIDRLRDLEEHCLPGEPGAEPTLWADRTECRFGRLAPGTRVAVVDAQGTRVVKLTGLATRRGYHGDELLAVATPVPRRGASFAILGRTVAPDTRLRPGDEPRKVTIAPKVLAALAARPEEIASAAELGSEGLDKHLKAYVKKAKRHVLRGRFQGGATHLVTLTCLVDEHDAGPSSLFEVMFFAKGTAAGLTELAGIVVHPSIGYGVDAPEWLLDVDGDGFDEVVVGSSCYEGSYELALAWDGTHASTRTLGGESAGGCAGLMSEAGP